MNNTFIEILRNITRVILLLLIILLVTIYWWFTPSGDFHYDKGHADIGKKIFFLEDMVKVENVKGYKRKDFSKKYSNYIFSRQEYSPESLYTENVEDDESFVIKNFFRFTRRGTGFRSDTNSTYYVIEDYNKKIFVLCKQFTEYDNKPLYKDYRYIIRD